MNRRPWIFFINPFLTATENSYKLAMELSLFHDAALKAGIEDAFILSLYDSYHPVHMAYMETYGAWDTSGGAKAGHTLNLTQHLRMLSKNKILTWDVAIQSVYLPDTHQYKTLLPHRRGPFQKGTQGSRIEAIRALCGALSTDPCLAALYTDVNAFCLQIDEIFTNQKGSKTHTNTLSDDVEAARLTMCDEQYGDLGDMIKHFKTHPELAAAYFDMAALRTGHQAVFTGHIAALTAHTVVKHTFGSNDEVRVINSGAGELHFYLASQVDGMPGRTFHQAPPNTDVVLPVSALGDVANAFLTVFNPDANLVGVYEVDME